MAATILDVAVLAAVGVEQRAQAITGGCGGRGYDPGAAKEAVADAEIQAPGGRQVGRGHGKRVLIGFAHRSSPA